MNTTTTPIVDKPIVRKSIVITSTPFGMTSKVFLIVTSGHGLHLVRPQWLVTSKSVAR